MNKIEALHYYAQEVKDIKEAGLFKGESPIVTPQSRACETGRWP